MVLLNAGLGEEGPGAFENATHFSTFDIRWSSTATVRSLAVGVEVFTVRSSRKKYADEISKSAVVHNVPSVPFSYLLHVAGTRRISLIKLDCQGCEYAVLTWPESVCKDSNCERWRMCGNNSFARIEGSLNKLEFRAHGVPAPVTPSLPSHFRLGAFVGAAVADGRGNEFVPLRIRRLCGEWHPFLYDSRWPHRNIADSVQLVKIIMHRCYGAHGTMITK